MLRIVMATVGQPPSKAPAILLIDRTVPSNPVRWHHGYRFRPERQRTSIIWLDGEPPQLGLIVNIPVERTSRVPLCFFRWLEGLVHIGVPLQMFGTFLSVHLGLTIEIGSESVDRCPCPGRFESLHPRHVQAATGKASLPRLRMGNARGLLVTESHHTLSEFVGEGLFMGLA